MEEFPCIICENGDVYSNIVCEKCQKDIELRDEIEDSLDRFFNERWGQEDYDLMLQVCRFAQTRIKEFRDFT